MTLTLSLTPELQRRLAREAERQGIPLDEYALQLLQNGLPPQDRSGELVALLQSWIDEEDAGQSV